MKKLIFTAAFVLIEFAFLTAQTLDEIIDYHFDAVNQDKFNQTKTIIIESDLNLSDGKGKILIFHKRPNKLRIEQTINQRTLLTLFDGVNCFVISGVDTNNLIGKDLEEIKSAADLDGYFFCYREKARDLKYIGEFSEGGKKFYQINCTEISGDTTNIFIDSKSYLIAKTIQHKNGTIKETGMENYKKIEDISFPHKLTTAENGKTKTQIVKKIKLNEELPEELFTLKK